MVSDDPALNVLRRVFGYNDFRPNQADIIREILAGRDVLAVMPTGGGKSLCYQLPARLLPGTVLVISPLIALMRDQTDSARQLGLKAAFINSSQTAEEGRESVRLLRSGELELCFVSPERVALSGFQELLATSPISLVAVDEAHCISEWGHEFRPDYYNLAVLTEIFPEVPVAAFTATATTRVHQDIRKRLKLRDPFSVRASFNRPNLFYEVRPREKAHQQVVDFLSDRPEESGILYRTTRKDVESMAERLNTAGVTATAYHAGLSPEERHKAQEDFKHDRVRVIVATIAFGMGIDKSNVRFVIHADLPKSLEAYYQETGRAGRDGEAAHCLLLFSRGDSVRQKYFIDNMSDPREREQALDRLRKVESFAALQVCRRRQILEYFGEDYEPENCGYCDICSQTGEAVDITRQARIFLSAMARTGERFGINHIIQIVMGANTRRLRELGHDQIKTWGAGRETPKNVWHRILDQLLGQKIIARREGDYPTLYMTPVGREVLLGHQPVRGPADILKTTRSFKVVADSGSTKNPDLFEKLRNLRKEIARQAGLPPYMVFNDKTLRAMSAALPENESQMASLHGVGARKLEQFGARFLAEIKEHQATTPTDNHEEAGD